MPIPDDDIILQEFSRGRPVRSLVELSLVGQYLRDTGDSLRR